MKVIAIDTGMMKVGKSRQGFVLLDALVAIVIFSIGIVGMVVLQGSAIQLTGAANYRVNAAMLADQVIAQMWASDPDQLQNNFAGSQGSGGAQYMTWLNTLDCTYSSPSTGCLPGVATHPPSINISQEAMSSSTNHQYRVTVTVNWQAPSDDNSHSYVSVTDIGY